MKGSASSLHPERFCPCSVQICRENWGRSCLEEMFAGRICQWLQGCLSFSKQWAGCVIWAHGEPKLCAGDVTVGWQVQQSQSAQEHCQAWGHSLFLPTSLPAPACSPSRLVAAEGPAQQIPLCAVLGIWRSVCRYEL